MFCGNCGKEINNGEKFCTGCGTPAPIKVNAGTQNQAFDAAADLTAATLQPGTASTVRVVVDNKVSIKAPSRKNWIITAAVLAVVVAAGIIIFNMYSGSKPSAVVEKFINAINEKDVNTAMKCMDPKYEKTFNAVSNLASGFLGGVKLTDIADLLPGAMDLIHPSGDKTDLQIKIVKVVSEDVSGDTAVVKVQLQGMATGSKGTKNNDSGIATFQLKKFNEGWRIINMK